MTTEPIEGFGLTVLRCLTGALMVGHGLQKLAGWFGGGGIEATAQGMQRMGLRPGRRHAIAAGTTETAAGALSVLGLLTPAASAMTTGTMTVAIARVHGKNGPWITKGGYEYNVTLMAVAFTLAAIGPGRLALDNVGVRRRYGFGFAVGQLIVGSSLAAALMATANRRTVSEPYEP